MVIRVCSIFYIKAILVNVFKLFIYQKKKSLMLKKWTILISDGISEDYMFQISITLRLLALVALGSH
jgi:hypothetical protein